MINQLTKAKLAIYQSLRKLGVEFQVLPQADVDFLVYDHNIGIKVQSQYDTPQDTVLAQVQRSALVGQGIKVVPIDERQALENSDFVVQEALQGRSHIN